MCCLALPAFGRTVELLELAAACAHSRSSHLCWLTKRLLHNCTRPVRFHQRKYQQRRRDQSQSPSPSYRHAYPNHTQYSLWHCRGLSSGPWHTVRTQPRSWIRYAGFRSRKTFVTVCAGLGVLVLATGTLPQTVMLSFWSGPAHMQ